MRLGVEGPDGSQRPRDPSLRAHFLPFTGERSTIVRSIGRASHVEEPCVRFCATHARCNLLNLSNSSDSIRTITILTFLAPESFGIRGLSFFFFKFSILERRSRAEAQHTTLTFPSSAGRIGWFVCDPEIVLARGNFLSVRNYS